MKSIQELIKIIGIREEEIRQLNREFECLLNRNENSQRIIQVQRERENLQEDEVIEEEDNQDNTTEEVIQEQKKEEKKESLDFKEDELKRLIRAYWMSKKSPNALKEEKKKDSP